MIVPVLITIACVVFFAFTLLLGLGKAAANGDALMRKDRNEQTQKPRGGLALPQADFSKLFLMQKGLRRI